MSIAAYTKNKHSLGSHPSSVKFENHIRTISCQDGGANSEILYLLWENNSFQIKADPFASSEKKFFLPALRDLSEEGEPNLKSYYYRL